MKYIILLVFGFSLLISTETTAQKKTAPDKGKALPSKPNIILIMPDDVGYWNVGAYNNGMMVPTPNIDRVATEGLMFTDHYSAPSCTPGRAMASEKDPTLAEILKPLGYKTGQFGKNHLGDRNEHLPTVHGFDEFYGNLYHLNTEEEPFLQSWPKDEGFNDRYRPRGVLDCIATQVDDPTVDPRFGKIGKQKIKDSGPLDPKRMETVDGEFLDRTLSFMEKSTKEGKPFFAWFNPSRMHIYTHLKPESRDLATPYSSEFDIYGSGMIELDNMVGAILKKLDELGIAENTIVLLLLITERWLTGSRMVELLHSEERKQQPGKGASGFPCW
jgi:arylsulfatase A-like enzyme